MTAITAFELLLKVERARWHGTHRTAKGLAMMDEALDAVRNELARCIREMLTPDEKKGPSK